MAALLCGCSSFRTEWGRPIGGRPDDFVEGKTRIATVIQELGPPFQVSALPGGCVFLYEHSVIGEFQIGISVDYSFFRYLKFVSARNHLDQDVLVLTFDDHGVLLGRGGKEWRESLGGGGAAQLLFASISLTDPALRLQRSDQLRWGRYDLQPLPVLLNADESLRTGEQGLQQRFVPKFAGQQTLEMAKPMQEKSRIKRQATQ
jgi:hypothetical protein